MVDISPWPFYSSFFSFLFVLSNVIFFSGKVFFFFFLTFSLFIFFQWWRDVSRESCFFGSHSTLVYSGIGIGIILFIVSELFLFFSFFWSFYHFGLRPSSDLGQFWPPVGLLSFDPLGVPFLNTLVLLSSGVTVTFSHNYFIDGNYFGGFMGLILTVILGVYFTLLQVMEYIESFFCLRDCCYGRVFFIGTGFHGAHVIIGSIFLLVRLFRFFFFHNGFIQILGFDLSVWYWHFVDVVWLFLYVSFYWWGSC